ncbi:MAG: MobF family relaxase [Ilumatobacteraceae bacterium]
MTTLFASGAGASAAYYTGYLTKADGELPGVWAGSQAPGLGLSGEVTTEALEALLSGYHPDNGMLLGRELADRVDKHGNTIRAVAGYDATLSAPKSLSVLWGLTGDERFAECHDVAVAATVAMIEKYASTTRVRSNGARLHPETGGLSMAVFRQSTSRADDPQLHTHVVISSKVQTPDGRWLALDALTLKKHQQAFGFLYQSVLRAEVTHRFGVVFEPIVNGQAEIAGLPDGLLERFSKRADQIGVEMGDKLADFHTREGREPSRFEYAAMEREAAVDTRNRKSGLGVADLCTRWQLEAASFGIDPATVAEPAVAYAHQHPLQVSPIAAGEVVEALAARQSAWNRMDILRQLCDTVSPQPGHDATTWATALDAAVDTVLAECVDLDPTDNGPRRLGDGRSVWIEPIAKQSTSDHVLAQEEHILTFALDAQTPEPSPSISIVDARLDDGQRAAASAVAGHDRLVMVVGPAGAGKTNMLEAAVRDLHRQHRHVLGLAPTARAASVLNWETGAESDTVAKLLYELKHPDRGRPWPIPPAGSTIIVDEAAMLNTVDLYRLVVHAEDRQWRLALIGDPQQLQAVGRGGMFNELCDTARSVELEELHRFTHAWEAATTLRLRAGDPAALATYAAHGRIRAGSFDDHLDTIADMWTQCRDAGESLSIVTTRNQHVAAINSRIQQQRLDNHELDPTTATRINDDWAMVGDVVVTRRNDRQLRTTTNEPVRNRERWTITDTGDDGDLTVSRIGGHGTITLPADYVRHHVQLAYAATEHGAQGDTADRSVTLATTATSGRGLYVGMSRGRNDNLALVADTADLAHAISVLGAAIAIDRADIPATTQRRTLAATVPRSRPRPRVQIPDWFHDLRADAEQQAHDARHAVDDRHERRAANERRYLDACRDLPAAEAAHAPFRQQVADASDVVTEARSNLWTAESDLRNAGKLQRRSARRGVEAANDVLTVATERLARCEQAAELTKRPLSGLRDIVDYHDRIQSTRDMLDDWTNLDAHAERAERVCDALDQWKHWANGHRLPVGQLGDVIAVLEHDRTISGTDQLVEATRHWAQDAGVDLPRPKSRRPDRSIELGINL